MSNKDNEMNEPWVRGRLVLEPSVARLVAHLRLTAPARSNNACIAHKTHARQTSTNDTYSEDLCQIQINSAEENDKYMHELEEEYWNEYESDNDNDDDIFDDKYEHELEKRYKREAKIKSLEELRQQLTFNVDESGEIHLVKRDINNNNIHITRVSKARDAVKDE